jgi:hypothetical protein
MLLWQSSSAPPAGILACLPASQHAYKARHLWPVQVLAPNGESPSALNRLRACVSHVGEHDEGPLVKTRSCLNAVA